MSYNPEFGPLGLDHVLTWGQPWHGRIDAGVLTLPNGATRAVPGLVQPGGDTTYFNAGAVAPVVDPSILTQGLRYFPDAVFFGSQRRYSPALAETQAALGSDGWLYAAPSGRRYHMRMERNRSTPGTGIAVGQTIAAQVLFHYLGPYGEMSSAAPSGPVDIPLGFENLSISNPFSTALFDTDLAGTPQPLYVHPHPNGSEALLLWWAARRPGSADPIEWIVLKAWRVVLSEPVAGAGPAIDAFTEVAAEAAAYAESTSQSFAPLMDATVNQVLGAPQPPNNVPASVTLSTSYTPSATLTYEVSYNVTRTGRVGYTYDTDGTLVEMTAVLAQSRSDVRTGNGGNVSGSVTVDAGGAVTGGSISKANSTNATQTSSVALTLRRNGAVVAEHSYTDATTVQDTSSAQWGPASGMAWAINLQTLVATGGAQAVAGGEDTAQTLTYQPTGASGTYHEVRTTRAGTPYLTVATDRVSLADARIPTVDYPSSIVNTAKVFPMTNNCWQITEIQAYAGGSPPSTPIGVFPLFASPHNALAAPVTASNPVFASWNPRTGEFAYAGSPVSWV